jgi:3-oxoacyl-[acyl-carrier protein] reductase
MIVQYPDLKGKAVLITGATRGIGRALAESLAQQGAHIAFNFREGKEEAAGSLEADLIKKGASSATPLLFDMTNTEQIRTALENYQANGNPTLTGLVNNAGISKDQLVLRLKEEDLDAVLDTNLKGAIMLTQLLTRTFMKAENVSIVNMSSIVGLMGNPSQVAYAASKAGLIGFTKAYAKELAGKNVRCNAVCPGFIKTDMTDALNDKAKETYLGNIPLGRFGETHEIANLICYLLSGASSYFTGEVFKIDGGLYI